MNNEKRIVELTEKITQLDEAYYNGIGIATDAEYDVLKDELATLAPEHPLLARVGAPVAYTGTWEKVKHKMPMGSLFKARDFEELKPWIKKHEKNDLIVSTKLDGLSLELNYEKGILKNAITRGDGIIGEDVTKNVKKIKNIPNNLFTPTDISIRGEVIIKKKVFVSELSKEFSNPRSAASGILRNTDNQFINHLDFIAYDYCSFDGDRYTFMGDMLSEFADFFKFSIPSFRIFKDNLKNKIESIEKYYKDFIDSQREEYLYEIDGLVVRILDNAEFKKQGIVAGRPKGAIALKFPPVARPSLVEEIEWSTSRTGTINPRVRVRPVQIGGVVVQYATLHNKDYMMNVLGGIGIGDEVLIERRGDIIPKVISVIKHDHQNDPIPTKCPSCGSSVYQENDDPFIYCKNLECSSRVVDRVYFYVSNIGMFGVGKGLIKSFHSAGLIKNIMGLYHIDRDLALSIDGIGEKKFTGFEDQLRKCSKNISLDKFLRALGIDGLGQENSEKFVNALGADFILNALIMKQRIKQEILEQTFTEATALKISNGLFEIADEIHRLLTGGVIIQKESKRVDDCLNGKTFCITGSLEFETREKYIEIIRSHGGSWKSSVSKGLSYLVTNEPDSGSTKNKAAMKYGIEVIDENQLRTMMGMSIEKESVNDDQIII